MEFGKILKMLRKEKGLTQQELGQMVGLKKEAIYKYEKGIVVNPKRSLIAKLANIFNVSPSYLLGISETRIIQKTEYTDDEKRLVENFRKLNSLGKERLEEQIKDMLQLEKYIEQEKSASLSA